MDKLLDKKVEFCLTPQIRSSARLTKNNNHIIQSTPFTKDGKTPFNPKFLVPNFKIEEDSMAASTYNLTSNSVGQVSTNERSLYPHQNANQIERICMEMQYLRLKLLNQKCEKKLEESSKMAEKSIRTAVELQRKKEDSNVQMCHTLERKLQLTELKERSDRILMHLNEISPGETLDVLSDQLTRYRAILIPALDTFKLVDIRSGNCLNELFQMVNKKEFYELVKANNELNERMKAIDAEKSKWKQTVARLKSLFKEFERLADLVKCLDKKGLL